MMGGKKKRKGHMGLSKLHVHDSEAVADSRDRLAARTQRATRRPAQPIKGTMRPVALNLAGVCEMGAT